MFRTVEQGLCLLGKSTIRPVQAQQPLVYLEPKWLRRAGLLQDQHMLLSVAEWPFCEAGGAAGWASELAWWAEPPSPEPDSRAQSLAKKERSARPFSQQGAVLSIQLANSAPPLSVTDSAIAPSAWMRAKRKVSTDFLFFVLVPFLFHAPVT